jgi:AcrR family transcriptional regulator
MSTEHRGDIGKIMTKSAAAAQAGLDRPRWEERSATPPESGREQSVARSRQIVDAAFDLLDEAGLEGLTIRAVLTRTGLSRRAFYERFAGKDDLVLAVFEQSIWLASRIFGEQIDAVADPIERLELLVTGLVLGRRAGQDAEHTQYDLRSAALSREHLRLAESRPADLQSALEPLIALIAKQLSDGMDAGLVRPGAPEQLAALVYNLVSTTMHTEHLSRGPAQPEHGRRARIAAEIWEFCRRAIAA